MIEPIDIMPFITNKNLKIIAYGDPFQIELLDISKLGGNKKE